MDRITMLLISVPELFPANRQHKHYSICIVNKTLSTWLRQHETLASSYQVATWNSSRTQQQKPEAKGSKVRPNFVRNNSNGREWGGGQLVELVGRYAPCCLRSAGNLREEEEDGSEEHNKLNEETGDAHQPQGGVPGPSSWETTGYQETKNCYSGVIQPC